MTTARCEHPHNQLVVGIAGRIGAGKTSAGEYLAEHHGFRYIRYSQVLSEWFANDSRALLQEIGWEVMSGGMQRELNQRLIAKIVAGADTVVDGLRHRIDVESLKKEFGSAFHLVFIDAPLEVRWDRRKNSERYNSFENFKAADAHPVEQQIDSLRPDAEAVIRNVGTLDAFYASLDSAIHTFMKGA